MIRMLRKRLIFLSILLSTCLFSSGQTISIKSVALQPSDKTAIEKACLDNNGDTCALIKIKTDNLKGIVFSNPNQYIRSSYQNGIYYVYIPSLSRKLDFMHKDYMPVQLDMANYGYKRLRKGNTYLVIIEAIKKQELMSSVVLKIEPSSAELTFDGEVMLNSNNGTYDIPVSAGRHNYSVNLINYKMQNGSITIDKAEVKTIPIRLQPITHQVLIGCNVDNARVYVDNVDYGRIGKVFIPQGKHNIRLQADGYVDSEQSVNISSSTSTLSFSLSKNMRVTHIHATPVRIYSASDYIYKNNKKIKEWTNGATIMFMPGKYLLSDDRGNTKKIIVGSEPMTVNF